MSSVISSSFVDIDTSSSMQNDRFVRLGNCVMHRKLDRSVVPANWKELWMCFRCSFAASPAVSLFSGTGFNYIDGTTQPAQNLTWNEFGGIMFGIYSSSGSAPYASGSARNPSNTVYESTFVSHSIFICDGGATNLVSASRSSTSSSWYSSNNTFTLAPVMILNNRTTGSSGIGSNAINIQFDDYKHDRRPFMARLIRSGNNYTMSWNVGTFSSSAAINSNSTNSAAIATAMNKSTFTAACSYLGLAASGQVGVNFITDEPHWGPLDTFFVSWSNPYYTMYMSDVVLRATGSF